jgi:hypothetical protein
VSVEALQGLDRFSRVRNDPVEYREAVERDKEFTIPSLRDTG